MEKFYPDKFLQASLKPELTLPLPETFLEKNIETCRDFQGAYEAAYMFIYSGLKYDQENQMLKAVDKYTKGLLLLEKVLKVNTDGLTACSSLFIIRSQRLKRKMFRTKEQVNIRLKYLQDMQKTMAPPSYQEAINECENPPPYSEDELTMLGESLIHRESSITNISEGRELFEVSGDVQLYYISKEGEVTAPSYPTSLQIIEISGKTGCDMATIFLSVGDWVYPLLPGQSPALATSYGAYIFPDTLTFEEGGAVGLILPEDLEMWEKKAFHLLLKQYTIFEDESKLMGPGDTSGRKSLSIVSKGILTAADWLSLGVSKGAEKADGILKKGSNLIQRKTKKCPKPVPINPNVKTGVMYAINATGGAVQVSGYVLNKVGQAIVHFSKEIAPLIRQQTDRVLPKRLSEENAQGTSAMDTMIEVAVTGLQGVSMVYYSLEQAAMTLGRSVVHETVDVVNHSFGEEAAELTQNTMYAAGNVLMTAQNVKNLGLKAIAKKTATATGQAMFDEIQNAKGTLIL